MTNTIEAMTGTTECATGTSVGEGERVDRAEKLETLFALCPTMLCVSSPDGGLLFTNRFFQELLGYSEDELGSINFWSLVHPDDLVVAAAAVASIAGAELTIEARILCHDGSFKWTAWRAAANADGTVMYAAGNDITSAKELERSTRDSEQRFRRVFDDGDTGIWLLGPNFRTLNVNPALCRMLGYTVDELSQLDPTDVIDPDDLKGGLARYQALLADGSPIYRTEQRFLTKSGELVFADLMVTNVHDADGAFLYSICMTHDISAIKAAQRLGQQPLALFARALSRLDVAYIVGHAD